MWKLTITQKRKYESMEGTYESSIHFVSDSLEELVVTIERLKMHETVYETSYKIESVAKEGEEG